MKNKIDISERKMKAFMATENPLSALRAAGWTLSALRAAGWTLSALRAAGWTLSDLIAAGWTLRDLRAAGWTEEDFKEWDEIPVLQKPYTRLLADIQEKKRVHDQSTFCPQKLLDDDNVCGTPMCTAGHLVQMAGKVGFELAKKYGYPTAARFIHIKSCPGIMPQNYGGIPQDFAMAYIEERAAEESKNDQSKESNHGN